VIILKRPGCVTAWPCSRALTTLLGMEAMAPVEPDVPWASANCVKASKEAMTKAECTNLDFMQLSSSPASEREDGFPVVLHVDNDPPLRLGGVECLVQATNG
jgi:hypothetical protein